jgi:hypothetical protein
MARKRFRPKAKGRYNKIPVNFDRWAHLEAAVRNKEKELAHRAQHGPVRIIVKDGKPVKTESLTAAH